MEVLLEIRRFKYPLTHTPDWRVGEQNLFFQVLISVVITVASFGMEKKN